MALTLSPAHETARQEAARLPALQESYNRLTAGLGTSVIQLFEGSAETGALLVGISVPASALSLDATAIQIATTAVIEGQIITAGVASGARIVDSSGDWWADVVVSDEAGFGDIKLQTTDLQAGAFARITSATFQG